MHAAPHIQLMIMKSSKWPHMLAYKFLSLYRVRID